MRIGVSMIPPILAACSKPLSECRRHNIGLRGGWAHPTRSCALNAQRQPLDQARYSVQMERIESTNADRIAWCCQQFGITPYEPATEVGISEKTLDGAMAGEAALTFAQK